MADKEKWVLNRDFEESSQDTVTGKGAEATANEADFYELPEGEAAAASGKSKKGKIILIIILILFLILVGYRVYENFLAPEEKAETAVVSVKTAVAEMGEIYTEAPVTAKLQASEEVYVIPMVAGEVSSVSVKNGDNVKEGQVLFKIDSSAIDGQVKQAREGVEQAQKAVDSLKPLYEAGMVSEADYESAKAALANAEIARDSAEAGLEYYTVKAPISGCLTGFSVSAGSVVGQSMVGTISNTSKLVIKATVAEKLAMKLNKGDSVDVYIASLDKTYKGKITEFSKVPSTGTVTYPVTISITDGDSSLMTGMLAELRIKTEENKLAVKVPSQAVFTKKGETVAVLLDGTIPRIVTVETGIDDGEYVEIVSGIEAGDTVVISGQQYVKDGEEVKVY